VHLFSNLLFTCIYIYFQSQAQSIQENNKEIDWFKEEILAFIQAGLTLTVIINIL